MQYRQEIDGLRAIAVLGVVLFHFGISVLSGGYAGVDVFFVISGFLITSILIKDVETKRFSFLLFYEKRIRRLFPALFMTMLLSYVAANIIFMPEEFVEFGQSMISATVYLSNVFFWLKSDYFNGPSELKPLLHTWSLAVEEQFYVILPLIIWICYKVSAKCFVYTVFICFLLSFVCTIYFIDTLPSGVFFLSPFRFWELLAGSLVALAFKFNKTPKEAYAPYLGYLGLVLIILPFFVLDKYSIFPGWAALPSCLGTVLLLLGNHKGTLLYKFLTLRWLTFTGKISYSLYLWHWPIVVFYGYWIIRDFYWWDTILLLGITYVVSYFSWRFLEVPFRINRDSGPKPKTVYITTIVTSCVVIVLGVFVWIQKGMPERFPILENQMAKVKLNEENKHDKCFLRQDVFYDNWIYEKCYFSQAGAEKTILLWGDSHALHLLNGLKYFQKEISANILVYASAGCSPMLDTDIPNNPQCRANNDHVRTILKTYPIDTIIMAGNWAWAFKVKDEKIDLSDAAKTFNILVNEGYRILFVNQFPIYPIKNPSYLAMRLASVENARPDYAILPDYGTGVAQQLEGIIPAGSIFSPQKLFCHKQKCQIYKDKKIMVVDEAHLSVDGSMYVVSNMLEMLKNKLN